MNTVMDMRFQALAATNMKVTIFWDVTPYSLVETDRRFGDTASIIRAHYEVLLTQLAVYGCSCNAVH
jgi:hypothetical protein